MQIQGIGNDEIRQRVQQKLDVMNKNWNALQEKALENTEQQATMMECSQGKEKNDTQTPPQFSPMNSYDSDSEEDVLSARQRSHFNYQLIFSELFDWLSSCDDSLSRPFPNCINIDIIRSRLFGLQVNWVL